MTRLLPVLVGATALLPFSVTAQQPVTDTLLIDLETTRADRPNSSTPVTLAQLGAGLWFAATSRDEGRELWFTDGTRAGTRRITDLSAGQVGSDPRPIAATVPGQPAAHQSVLPNGTMLFAATADGVGRELWAVDPTSAQPRLVRDIRPGIEGSEPRNGAFWQGEYWFFADDGQHGVELWRTDGTTAGTVLADDLAPGAATVLYGTENLVAAAGRLWFRSTFGSDLWVKDAPGTPARVVLGVGRSSSGWLHAGGVAGGIVFVNDDPIDGGEPWFSDGTATGTRQLADLVAGSPGSDPYLLGSDGALVWFRANDRVRGTELYVSNGTPAGTQLVADIRPGVLGSLNSTIHALVDPVSGDLLFNATDGTSGYELHRSDGTAAGTRRVADIDPGSGSAYPSGLRLVGRAVVFSAATPGLGRELYAHDLQSGVTLLLDDLWNGIGDSNPGLLGTVGQTLVLAAYTGRGGVEPWTATLQPGTARPLRDLYPGPTSRGSAPSLLGTWRDKAFFGAFVTGFGAEPWATDGTAAGTVRLADILPGIGSFDPIPMGACEHGFVMTNRGGLGGYQLWISDGTPAGTRQLPGFDSGQRVTRVFLGSGQHGRLYFTAEVGGSLDAWVTDGTAAGTAVLRPLSSGNFLSITAPLGEDLALGVGGTNATGGEPWVTDGTPAGTRALGDLRAGSASSQPAWFTEVGRGAVFSADDGTHGRELWFTRGSPASTVLLKDILPGPDGSDVRNPVQVGDRVVFVASTPTTGEELWVTDGTPNGTTALNELVPGTADASPVHLTSVGLEHAWFVADPNGTGAELWITDGTNAGTRSVRAAQASSPRPQYPIRLGDGPHIAFAENSNAFGTELWTSDGTVAGTRPLTDSNRGPNDSMPYGALRLGDRLLFTADDGAHGREVHVVELGTAGAWVASPYGGGCGGTLSHNGTPVLGSQLDLVSETAPRIPTAFVFGAAPAWRSLGVGCQLHVDTPIPVAAANSDPNGRSVLALPVPNQPALLGDLLHFQSFSLTQASALVGSNGFEVVLGR